jgi:hypothetical protein
MHPRWAPKPSTYKLKVGYQYLAIRIFVLNLGSVKLDGDANVFMAVVAGPKQIYTPVVFDSPDCVPDNCVFFGENAYDLSKSKTLSGWVIFHVPNSFKLREIRYTVGGTRTYWSVSGS